MHIDLNAAGLLAQVIPTLLIFLLLEGRLVKPVAPRNRAARIVRLAHVWVRSTAIFMSLATTFACLFGVMYGHADWSPWIDAAMIVSVLMLFCALYFMLVGMIAKEYGANM